MDEKHSFMDQLNLFFIGAVIGTIIGTCFSINVYKGKNANAENKLKAYEQYYKRTETLLDSLSTERTILISWTQTLRQIMVLII